MKEKETTSSCPENQEASWASFFYVDPENWPDLPPPVIKYKRRYLGRRRIRPSVEKLQSVLVRPPVRPFPPSKLISHNEEWGEIKRKEQQENQWEKKYWELRKEGRELIQKCRAGEISHSDASDFYLNHAIELVPEKQYQSYKDYAKSNNRQEVLTWPDWARLVVIELFTNDFMGNGKAFLQPVNPGV